MTKKPLFKVFAVLIITALFGYLLYMLYDSVKTGLFFQEETDKNVITVAAALMGGPIVLSIICSILRKRYLWLLSIVNLFVCAAIGAGFGEETTMAHAYVYALMVIVPYILCLNMLLKEKKEYKPKPYPAKSSSYSGSYGSASGGYSHYNRPLNFSEKEDYILRNCHSAYSWSALEKIENDPNLTAAQKEDLKNHLRIYGD